MSRTPPFAGPNPHRLYRRPDCGVVGGVCAGIADYFGIDPFIARLATVVAAFFFLPVVVVGYVVAVLALPARPAALYRSEEDEAFWRAMAIKPDRTLGELSRRLKSFERRVAGMEAYVASKDYELNRAFRDLER